MTPLNGQGLALGDARGTHVLLRPDRLSYVKDGRESESAAWSEVRSIELDVPTTGWPVPALGDVVMPLLSGVFVSIIDPPEVRPFYVTVRVPGVEHDWEVGSHHVVGYSRRTADVMKRTVEYLRRTAAARAMLREPARLLERLPAS